MIKKISNPKTSLINGQNLLFLEKIFQDAIFFLILRQHSYSSITQVNLLNQIIDLDKLNNLFFKNYHHMIAKLGVYTQNKIESNKREKI